MIKEIIIAAQFALIIVLIMLIVWTNKRVFYKLSGFIRIGFLGYKNKKTIEFPGNAGKYTKLVDSYIANDINENVHDILLREVLNSSCTGKKIRPSIVIATYQSLANIGLNEMPKFILASAAAIEYIHCSSLIIDDIMDGDKIRRGKPSIYAKFGIDIAQMAAVILFTFAIRSNNTSLELFLKNLQNEHSDSISITETVLMLLSLMNNLFTNTVMELCTGQYYDILAQTVDIFELMDKKTGCLYEMAFLLPWILYNKGAGEQDEASEMCAIGRTFGQLFQLCDDFDDVEKDRENGRPNYVVKVGYKNALAEYDRLDGRFRQQCEDKLIWGEYLRDITSYMRKSLPQVHL